MTAAERRFLIAATAHYRRQTNPCTAVRVEGLRAYERARRDLPEQTFEAVRDLDERARDSASWLRSLDRRQRDGRSGR